MPGDIAGFGPLLLVALGLLGALLSLLGDWIIARRLPRLGQMPPARTRLITAVLSGILCFLLAARIGTDAALPAFLVLGVMSVQLGRIDLVHHLLPNPLVLSLLIAGLVLLTAGSTISMDWPSLMRAFAGAALLFFVYLALALISPAGLGMGDVKLAAPLGLYLGWLDWSALFYGGALGFVMGGLVSAGMLATKRTTKNSEVAFGPSMLGAALATVLVAG